MKTRAALLAALAACADVSVPEDPTWADVAPILAANCVRCHGAPASGGAPEGFRLDTYSDALGADGRFMYGAATMAEFVAARVADGSMPPRYPLRDDQIELLQRWSDQRFTNDENAVIPPPRGDGPAGNRAPSIRVVPGPITDGWLDLDYEVTDADGGLVVGTLRAEGTPQPLIGPLHAGRGTLRWDVALLPSGPVVLTAALDDGGAPVSADAGTVTVLHDDDPPPRAQILSLAEGAIVHDRDAPVAVAIQATSPRGADLTVDVAAVDGRDGTSVPIADDVAFTSGMVRIVDWDPTALAAGGRWRLEVTATDGVATSSTQVARLTVSHATTTESFATLVEEVIEPRCAICHSDFPRVPGFLYNFTSYQSVDGRVGAYDLRGELYRRVVLEQNMPPPSYPLVDALGQALTDAERARLASWLLAGAPETP